MSSKRPRQLPSDLPRGKVIAALKRLGLRDLREGGWHTVCVDPDDPRRLVAIPRHAQIKRLLLRGILAGVGITEQQFMERY